MQGRRDTPEQIEPPEGLCVHRIEVAGVDLVVLSYPAERPDSAADTPLTQAEAEVAELAVQGLSNAEIGAARGTSVRTVANQMASVLRKLRLGSRRELATTYARGLLTGPVRRSNGGTP